MNWLSPKTLESFIPVLYITTFVFYVFVIWCLQRRGR